MKDLLSKEYYCYKIHALLMKSTAYLLLYRHPHDMGNPLFLQENLDPPFYMIFKKSQPSCNPIIKRGGGGDSHYEYYI